MSWEGSDRRARLPDDWPQRVEFTRNRAGGRCEMKIAAKRGGRFRCTADGTDCDHINRGDDHRVENLQWLCERHHQIKTAAEGNEAKADKKKPRREPPKHPGLLRKRS